MKKIQELQNKNPPNITTSPYNKVGTLFYPRVVNNFYVVFSTPELMLVQKGLKYNLHHKPNCWIEKLALEADTAINLVNPPEDNYLRHTIAKHLKKLMNRAKQLASCKNHLTAK
jgi:hypothetical protein